MAIAFWGISWGCNGIFSHSAIKLFTTTVSVPPYSYINNKYITAYSMATGYWLCLGFAPV